MKSNNAYRTVISKISAMLLALVLCMSAAVPMAGMDVYADTDSKAPAAEESKKDAAKESAKKKAETPAATSITGYKASYNKRYSQALKIEADITPAGDREVQLQRYSNETSAWTTILTAKVAPKTETTATADQATTETAAATASTETASATAADANTTVAANTDAAATTAVVSGPAVLTEDNGVAHVTFSVPKEERQKTTSYWRIYVPATKKAAAATSERITVTTRNLEDLSISARNACIYRIDGDGVGTMIFSRNSATPVAQASTTKIMSAVVLLESGLIDSTTQISAHAASTPYASGRLAVGDVYNTRDLLYAMLLPSSNDAATAVAERVGGSEAGFVNMMNAKAEAMGFTKTHFRNPHGLDADGHYTTALELAKLTAYAYTFPEIRDCWATQYKTIKSLERGRKWTLWSTNAIFSYVSNFLGGKTGTESNAGCCFTGIYTYGGSTYVTVVLGSGYGFSRWSDTKKLHKYIQDYAASSY